MTKLILRRHTSEKMEVVKKQSKKVSKLPRNDTTDRTTEKQGKVYNNSNKLR